ncbi:MAG: pitrilysin family protein [Gemmatimonadota bacterium]
MAWERIETVRSVALGIWVEHGGAHDAEDQKGLAHLLEHMVFKGTRTRTARQIAVEIEQVGGSLDAYTSHDHTGYLARVPEEHLEIAVDVLAGLVFHPVLRRDDLRLEREVILEELAGLEDSPDQLVFELHGEQLYGRHPYGRSILGTARTVASIGTEDLERLQASAYVPGNCVIAAAGRLTSERLLEAIDRRVPEAGEPARHDLPPLEPGSAGFRLVERPGGRQSHIVAGALAVPHSSPLRYAVILVEAALGGGMSSRLFQHIREDLGLAYSVYSYHAFYRAAGHVGAYLGTRPETAERAREELISELRAVAEEGLTSEEVEQMKRQLKGQLLVGLESTVSRMQRLAGLSLYREPYITLDELADRIDGITPEQIAEAAAFFHPDRLSVLELRPVEDR